MQAQAFHDYLISIGIPSQKISQQITFIENIERLVKSKVPSWTLEDLNQASAQAIVDELIDRGENSLENLLAIARYAKAIKNQELFLSIFQLLDGYEAMEGLYEKLGAYVGEDLREIIFEDLPLPPLGLSNREKALYAYRIINRMETIFDETTIRDILKDCLRHLPTTYYEKDISSYWNDCGGDIDCYLKMRGERFVNTLKDYQLKNELFFGQEINDEVIEFVRANPEIGQGVRIGNIIYETKIPYNTKDYIAERDPDKKRYHYCHCPWAKESLRRKGLVVPSVFCQCSAGFHKKPFEAIYEKPVKAEVLKSVLKGDLLCRFAIYLPDE
jgi:hypothetical protein